MFKAEAEAEAEAEAKAKAKAEAKRISTNSQTSLWGNFKLLILNV